MAVVDAMALPTPDWLHHSLVVTGPAEAVAEFQTAARGAGAIPWQFPDIDAAEEDQASALVRPPDGSRGLSLTAARILARQLRAAVEAHQQSIVTAVGYSRACAFDLHALIPVPPTILRRGPADAASVAWLRSHWGVVQALRQVRLSADAPDGRLRRSARLDYGFWSADWTPWAALTALRKSWPGLVFDLRPDYARD